MISCYKQDIADPTGAAAILVETRFRARVLPEWRCTEEYNHCHAFSLAVGIDSSQSQASTFRAISSSAISLMPYVINFQRKHDLCQALRLA